MPERDAKWEKPTYEELVEQVAQQREGIADLHKTIEEQDAMIAALQAATPGRWWKQPRGTAWFGATPKALGVRVEAILRLAEKEAADLREEARQAAAAQIAEAEREAARIRAEASNPSASDQPADAGDPGDSRA